MKSTADEHKLASLLACDMADPFSVLGMHRVSGERPGHHTIAVRALIPTAESVIVTDRYHGNRWPMTRLNGNGLFEAQLHDRSEIFEYQLEIHFDNGSSFRTHDPYSFLPVISEFDLHLFNAGNHHRAWEKLGAHITTINHVQGVHFAVWAPSARRVSLVGTFNSWDGRRHMMRRLGNSGVFEIFVPGVVAGDLYKFEILTPSGEIYVKSDPYAFQSELRPATASVVCSLKGYPWEDAAWVAERRASTPLSQPLNIYEMHLGTWSTDAEGSFLSLDAVADRLIPYIQQLNYTHVEFLPVMEHPFDGSWGYQVTGFYAPTRRFGTPDDYRRFVDRLHAAGIGVILDWVPAHFPKDAHGLARFDGTALYEHFNPMRGENPGWGTHVFNFERHEVRNFLVSNALYWLEEFHADGLRVDAVASMLHWDYCKEPGQWLPNKYGGREIIEGIEFLRQLNSTVSQYHPGVMMIAEESSTFPMVTRPTYIGGLGFTFKWNMGWMNDFLKYLSLDPIHRKYYHNLLTFAMMYHHTENYVLVLSHDEVVHGKKSMLNKIPGDYWQKFAGLRAAYGFFFGHPGKKLLFMGGEFGQFIEWKDDQGLDWHLLDYPMHAKLHHYVRDLNTLYRTHPAMYERDYRGDGFEWIDCNDNVHSIISFMRKGKDWRDMLIFVINFTPVGYDHYRIGLPAPGHYDEILNSDAEVYGGTNVGNCGGLDAEDTPHYKMQYSAGIRIPPYGAMIFQANLKGPEALPDTASDAVPEPPAPSSR